MGSSVRALLGAIVFLGVIGFLLIGMQTSSAARRTVTDPSAEKVQFWRLYGKERHHFHRDMDLNNVSKRRVPNGPDPIHNRRAEKFRQPPGA